MSHRLATIVFAVATLVSTAQANEEVNEILVFGDVSKPGVFQVKNLPTVSELLARIGGTKSESGSVKIVRNSPKGLAVAWASHVSKNQPCNFKVQHGDMVIVHSLDRMSGRRIANEVEVAIIHPSTRPLIVTLDAGKVTAGAVLTEVKMDDRPFRIIRTDPRQTAAQANTETILAHGDIVLVEEVAQVREAPVLPASTASFLEEQLPPEPETAAPQRLMIPVSDSTPVQEVSIQDVSADTDGSDPIPVQANYGGISTPTPPPSLSPPAPPTGGTIMPGLQPPPTTESDPFDTSLVDKDPWENGQPRDPRDLQYQPNGNQLPPNNQYPNAANGQYGSVPQMGSAPSYPSLGANGTLPPRPDYNNGGMPAVGGQPTAQAPATTQQDGTQTSLPLPSDLNSAVKEGSNSTMWYAAGLFGALMLVLGAWVYGSRAMADTPQVRQQDQYKRPVSRRHSTTVKQQPVSQAGTLNPGIPAPKPKPATPDIKPITAATQAASNAATNLGATAQEALKPIANPPIPEVQTPARPQVAVANSMPPAGFTPPQTSQPQVAQPYVAATAQPAVIPVPVAAQATPQPYTPPQPAAYQPPAVAQQPVVPAPPVQSEPIPVPNTDTTRILDALINNAIPINEQPVQLPTHLEFFGDSNGPKQLRIDPPQTALRGPHIGHRAGVSQQQPQSDSSYAR